MRGIEITIGIARAAGHDAGNRNMVEAGRDRWNEDDWNVAVETMNLLMNRIGEQI